MSEPTQTQEAVVDSAIDVAGEGFIESIDAAFAGLDMDTEVTTEPEVKSEPEVKKEETETTEPDDAEDPLADIDVDVKDWTPEAARAFKEVKTELKAERQAARELRETLQQREARISELESVASDPKVDEMRQKLQEYESKLLVTDLESTQAYKDLVEVPLKSVLTESDAIATKYGVDPDELFDAIALDDEAAQEEKISELLASASERDRFKAYQLIEALKPIKSQQEALRANSEEALREARELDQYRQQEQLRERAEARKQATQQVADRIASKLTFLNKIEGVDMSAIVKETEAVDPSTLSPVAAAYNQMTASLFPKIAREFVKMTKENELLIEKLAAYDKSSPRIGNNSSAGTASPDGVSFVDAVARAFGG
jgi:hypothetical protein